MDYKELLKKYLQYIYLEDVDCVNINGENWNPKVKLTTEEKLELRTLYEVQEKEGMEEGLVMGAIETIQYYDQFMHGKALAEELRKIFGPNTSQEHIDIEYWIKYYDLETGS